MPRCILNKVIIKFIHPQHPSSELKNFLTYIIPHFSLKSTHKGTEFLKLMWIRLFSQEKWMSYNSRRKLQLTYRIEYNRTLKIYASSVDLLILLHWYLSIHTAKRFESNKMEKKSKIVKKVLKSVTFPHISYFLFLGYWHFLYVKYNNMWERFPRSIKKAQHLWERNPKFN